MLIIQWLTLKWNTVDSCCRVCIESSAGLTDEKIPENKKIINFKETFKK